MSVEEIFGKDYKPFQETDPFNDRFVEGYICHRQSDLYGALLIEKVDGRDVPQLIYATPKIAYPFDKNERWNFPKAVRIERYEKLDGTNIFSFQCKDSEGIALVSYKTRLLPFVGNSKFGPFRDMVKEMLADNQMLLDLPVALGFNISYELWGARNPHLVLYDVPLCLSILFGRRGDKVLPPSQVNIPASLCVGLRGVVTEGVVASYQESQKAMDSALVEVEGKYKGTEGEVWYLLTDTGDWRMFKCKPETIEMIHWANSGIGKNVIRATIENAYENWDNPTVENVVSLLLEEFPQAEIDKRFYLVKWCLSESITEHEFKAEVLEKYSEMGISLLQDKATVMRHLSTKFAKSSMKKVYSIIWAEVSK